MNNPASSLLDIITAWGIEAFFYFLRHTKEILGGLMMLSLLITAVAFIGAILSRLFGKKPDEGITPPEPSGNFGT